MPLQSMAKTELGLKWEAALEPVRLRYPDPDAIPNLRLFERGEVVYLEIAIDNALDSLGDFRRLPRLTISTVELTFFPGDKLARAWLAVGWAGYLQHEAMELVTVGDDLAARALDPHMPLDVMLDRLSVPAVRFFEHGPFVIEGKHGEIPLYAHDRGVRDGLPASLTPQTMARAFEAVMPGEAALEIFRSFACAS